MLSDRHWFVSGFRAPGYGRNSRSPMVSPGFFPCNGKSGARICGSSMVLARSAPATVCGWIVSARVSYTTSGDCSSVDDPRATLKASDVFGDSPTGLPDGKDAADSEIDAGRLLILLPFPPKHRRIAAGLAEERNRFVATPSPTKSSSRTPPRPAERLRWAAT